MFLQYIKTNKLVEKLIDFYQMIFFFLKTNFVNRNHIYRIQVQFHMVQFPLATLLYYHVEKHHALIRFINWI